MSPTAGFAQKNLFAILSAFVTLGSTYSNRTFQQSVRLVICPRYTNKTLEQQKGIL